MKRDHYPSAMSALISAILGILCFLVIIFSSTGWFDELIYAYLFFFVLSIALGGYSLFIKPSRLAWTGVIIGVVFVVLLLIVIYMFKDMCVIC